MVERQAKGRRTFSSQTTKRGRANAHSVVAGFALTAIGGTWAVRYAHRVNDPDRAPWAEPPATPAPASAPWDDPPELVAVRASVSQAQGRIDRATRQLELAHELEARLQALLEGRSGQGVPPLASPERHAAEVEATAILLKAELRAAKILNATGNPEGPSTYTAATIDLDAARALEVQLSQLADIETSLAAIGKQLRLGAMAGEPGPSRLALDGAREQREVRRAGSSVPVPLFRRPRRGNPT
jgi:hypothetical protein